MIFDLVKVPGFGYIRKSCIELRSGNLLDIYNMCFGCVNKILDGSEVNFSLKKSSFRKNSEVQKDLDFVSRKS